MMMMMRYAVLLALSCLAASPAHTQTAPMPGMPHDMAPVPGEAASTTAYKNAIETMHKDMMIDYTGNADRDFVAGMIPHHEGAIGMAQVELKFGNDPELRKLARQIITDQTREIALMRRWQTKHGQKHAE
jgi:uncharacterized protein (DUF305 family)